MIRLKHIYKSYPLGDATVDVLKDVNVAAVTENAQWGVTFQQGYSDGNTVQVSLALTGPNQDLDRYSGVDVGNYGRTSTATINGEAAELVGVNPFYERNGQWTSTLSLTVPESQREAETLEVALTLRDLSGRVKGDKGESSYQTESINGDFEGAFSLIPNYAYAEVFSASGAGSAGLLSSAALGAALRTAGFLTAVLRAAGFFAAAVCCVSAALTVFFAAARFTVVLRGAGLTAGAGSSVF